MYWNKNVIDAVVPSLVHIAPKEVDKVFSSAVIAPAQKGRPFGTAPPLLVEFIGA